MTSDTKTTVGRLRATVREKTSEQEQQYRPRPNIETNNQAYINNKINQVRLTTIIFAID